MKTPILKLLKFHLFVAYIFSISCALGQEVGVKKESGKIFLTGKSCALLMKQANAIHRWKNPSLKNLNPNICSCSENCSINVTQIVPQIVQEKQEVCSLSDGPNCWNSSLVTSGILPNLRYSTGPEMKFWMESPLCRERSPNEEIEPGDVVAIRDSSGDEVHGFIHITEELSFSKNGYSKNAKYSLQSPSGVFEVYGVEAKCRREFKKPSSEKACALYANYFKCEPIDEYLKANPIKNSEQLDTWKALDSFECEISGIALSNFFKKDQVELFKLSISSIQSLAAEKVKSNNISQHEIFIWKGIQVKTQSLIEQIELL